MIAVVIIVVIILIGIGGIIALAHSKKSCTCIGKPCGTDDGCGNICCDASKGQKCVGGKCCDASCDGLSCDQTNGCGESCADILCGDQICYQGNCCTQDCRKGSCTKSCGQPCPCPNPNDICRNGECCTPLDCNTGICGNEPKCGEKKCICQDGFCPNDGCCVNGKCTYQNICKTKKGDSFDSYFKKWARFCDKVDKQGNTQCINCELKNAGFERVGDSLSVMPTNGTIDCEQCLKDGKYVDAKPVEINSASTYYENSNGEITQGALNLNKCKDQPGGCDSCVCLTSADCKRWGCDGYDCVGMTCQKS